MQTIFNFTKAEIDRLPLLNKQYEVRDLRCDGLALRVNNGGTKSFYFWKKKNGRNIKIKIGRFPDITIEQARKQADLLRVSLNNGKLEIKEEVRPARITFNQLYERYYTEYAVLHTKRPDDNRAQLKFHILDKIGNDYVGNINKARMKAIHKDIGLNRGKPQANRMLNMVSAIFNFGINEELYYGPNPCNGIRRFKRRTRDRFLRHEELGKFFEALESEPEIFRDFFTLSILIGARKGVMTAMKFSDLDFTLKTWRICEDESKNDEVNIFHLCDHAIHILEKRLQQNIDSIAPSPFVFPGVGNTGHLINVRKAYVRIRERMGVTDITIHDLRRTLGSYMAINNTSMPIIAQALNHRCQTSTEIYARLSQEPVAKAVAAAGEKILEIAKFQREKSPWAGLNPYNPTPTVSFSNY